jgi:hypothetical protein
MNENPDYSNMDLLKIVKPRMDYLMNRSGKFQTCDIESKPQQDCLTYQISRIETIKEIFDITSAINDYFYQSVIFDKTVYNEFIADVPQELKTMSSSDESHLFAFHFQTNMIEIIRETLLIYNKILPFLFQHGFFEEIYDGFLAFFHHVFDLSFLFREDNSPDGAGIWFDHYQFKLPDIFYQKSLGFANEKLQKTKKVPNGI